MNWQETYRESSVYVGWRRGTHVYNISVVNIHPLGGVRVHDSHHTQAKGHDHVIVNL